MQSAEWIASPTAIGLGAQLTRTSFAGYEPLSRERGFLRASGWCIHALATNALFGATFPLVTPRVILRRRLRYRMSNCRRGLAQGVLR